MTTQQQDFKAEVGQVIQAETVTQVVSDLGRALTYQERVELNKQVKQLEQDYGIPSWETWRFLHKTIGVQNVGDMRLGHRDSAHAIVELMLDLAEAKMRSGKGQTQNENTAGELARALSQNAELTAKQAESQAHNRQARRPRCTHAGACQRARAGWIPARCEVAGVSACH